MKNNKQKKEVSGIQSLKATIIGMILVTVAFCIACSTSAVLPKAKQQARDNAKESMLSLSTAYGRLLEADLQANNGSLSYEQYVNILKDVKLSDYASSYVYVVDAEGTMLYHPTQSKVGVAVENSVISNVVTQLQNGQVVQPEAVTYMFKGVEKYAGYFITSPNNEILVVTADRSDIFEVYKAMIIQVTIGNVVIFLVSLGFAIFIANLMTRPMKKLEAVVDNVADLNLNEDEAADQLARRRDEYGVVARAILRMKQKLNGTVQQIAQVSGSLDSNSIQLQKIASDVNDNSSDNSATSEELAASMQETSATTEAIDSHIEQINNNTQEIDGMTKDGKVMAEEILKRAKTLMESTQKSRDAAREVYGTVKDKTNDAINKSKSVEKIHTLTQAIMDIASQTSLLSLNASIEAARAGDSGRGFAVVASEIGSLAAQSTATVSNITEIVDEVQDAVNNMTECLSMILTYLEETVTKDYDQFIDVSYQYENDANKVSDTMEVIFNAINQLQITVMDIAEAISGINHTINEATTGVTDIAQKTSNTVELTLQTTNKVNDCVEYADQLKGIVSQFKL